MCRRKVCYAVCDGACAIGIVVDDAIVVVENVERYLRQGMTPKDAAHKTMDEVGGALIAISLVLIGVFLPTAFITGLQVLSTSSSRSRSPRRPPFPRLCR